MGDMHTAGRPIARLLWIDTAKGLCIGLVVLWHVSLWFDSRVDPGPGIAFWYGAGEFLEPLRMPLFFFISGLLVAGAVTRPVGVLRRKTLGLLYLYVLWTVMFLGRLAVPGARAEGEAAPGVGQLLAGVLLPTSFW